MSRGPTAGCALRLPSYMSSASTTHVREVVMATTKDVGLKAQFDFLLELDRLKSVVRQSSLANGSRRENSAEHSWHLAMFALVLSEHADVQVNVAQAVRIVLVHALVEVDAGDAAF